MGHTQMNYLNVDLNAKTKTDDGSFTYYEPI
jgi:hypothetical protein